MKSIVLAAAKGGVGKTTLAAGLATAALLESPSARVVLLDLDPQGSLTHWWNIRQQKQPELRGWSRAPLAAILREVGASGADFVFVDCPPGFSSILEEAIACADLVLIPVQASTLDLVAVSSTVAMAKRARVPHRLVLNRAVFRSRLAGTSVQALRSMGCLLWPPLHQRVAVAEAMAGGRTALEAHPAGAAAAELAAAWNATRVALETPPRFAPAGASRIPVLAVNNRSRT